MKLKLNYELGFSLKQHGGSVTFHNLEWLLADMISKGLIEIWGQQQTVYGAECHITNITPKYRKMINALSR